MAGIHQLSSLSRRKFLAATGLSAGALVIGATLPTGRGARAQTAENPSGIGAFLAIEPEGGITFFNPFVEMGQGTYTSIPAIVAEELDVELDSIRVVQAPAGPQFRTMAFGPQKVRFTGGSLSVRSSYQTFRQVGASARAVLIRAAAAQWGVPEADCATRPGMVVHDASNRAEPYGRLAAAAAMLDLPVEPALKDPAQFRLIGRPVKRTDSAVKSNGQAEFGIDVRVPGMVYAAVKQSPVFGGSVRSFDAAAIADRPGVIGVEAIPNGVAVLADSFWRAKSAIEALPVEFDDGPAATVASAAVIEAMRARLDEPGVAAESVGDAATALAGAMRTVTADYLAPFLAHATLEPMNCTAHVTDAGCTVWAPNQGADFVANVAAEITGLPVEAIDVRTPFLGGGFGRRFVLDYVIQAVTLSHRLRRPVKVVWTREEDTQHDHYRPLTLGRFRAGLDAAGMPIAFHATLVGEGPLGRLFASMLADPNIDTSVVEGTVQLPYGFASRRVDYVRHPIPAPIGFWRSVGHSFSGFFTECFLDELAAAAGRDPVEYRRTLLSEKPRFRRVLDAAVELAGYRPGQWAGPHGAQRSMGVALHESFGSIVAQVAEVSLSGGQAQVHRVWCVVDCGVAVNPAIIAAQMESGIAFGLSQTLLEEVTIENGQVVQGNFDSYPILPPDRMPAVEVTIIESGEAMGGIGEPGTPSIAPAVVNAVAKLTGQRIRALPLSKVDLHEA